MSKPTTRKDAEEVEGTAEEQALSLSFLSKFIKPFDRSREKLNAFINNCNNALSLASSSQEEFIFKYILSQLEGKAEIACSIKEFDSWNSLKAFLKHQFGERKHTAHLLSDLKECKQGSGETVNQFALKLETCLSQLMTEINNYNYRKEPPILPSISLQYAYFRVYQTL